MTLKKLSESASVAPKHPYLLEIENLEKSYRKTKILKGISFKLERGKIYGLIGPNGAGKTTLIKCVMNAIVDYSGNIKINNVNSKLATSRTLISYVPEDNYLIPNLNVYDSIYHMALLKGLDRSQAKAKANQLIEEFELNLLRKRNTTKLSSGQVKKVLLAQAFVADADFYLLDEPAANLDPPSRLKLFSSFRNLIKDGQTILISSHILDELEKVIEEVIIIQKGELKLYGNLNKLKRQTNQSNIITLNFEVTHVAAMQAFLEQESRYQKRFRYDSYKDLFFLDLDSENELESVINELNQKQFGLKKFQYAEKSLSDIYSEIK